MNGAVTRSDPKSFLVGAVLFLILLVGLFLRVGAVLNTMIDTPVRADAKLYYFYSLNLDEHGVFSKAPPATTDPVPDAFAPPVFPLALTPFLEFPPTDRMVVHIGLAQALLGALTIGLTFFLARAAGGNVVGLLSAALVAISPHLISLTTYMLTETLFTFVMMAGLLAGTYAIAWKRRWLMVVAGLLLGIAALTRSTLEYFPLFLLVLLALPPFRNRMRIGSKSLWLLALIAFAVILAWKLRNLLSVGAMSDPSLMIFGLQSGMYPNLTFEGHPESLGMPYRFDPRSAEITASLGSVLNEIKTRFITDPIRHLQWYLFGKPSTLLSWSMIDGWGDIFVYPVIQSPYFTSPVFQGTRMFMLLLHPVLMIMGFMASLVVLFRPHWLSLEGMVQEAAILLSLMAVYFILLHMVGAPYPRYGVPLRPVMYGLAMLLLMNFFGWIAEWARRRRQG